MPRIDDVDAADVAIVCDIYTPIDTAAARPLSSARSTGCRRMHAKDRSSRRSVRARWCWPKPACSTAANAPVTGRIATCSASTTQRSGSARTRSSTSQASLRRHHRRRRNRPGTILRSTSLRGLCGTEHALQDRQGLSLLAGHEDGQLPFAAMSRRIQKSDAVIGQCQAWIARELCVRQSSGRDGRAIRSQAAHLRAPLPLGDRISAHGLCACACASRKPNRSSKPKASSIDNVGFQVGYEDPTFFRRLFKRKVGLTPAAYRRKFACIVAAGKRPAHRDHGWVSVPGDEVEHMD